MPASVTTSPPSGVAPILEYQSKAPETTRWPGMIVLLLVLPAAVVPFVAFTYDVSPVAVVVEFCQAVFSNKSNWETQIFLVAAPFFLGLAIVFWQARLLIWGRLSFAERFIAYGLAALSSLLSLGFFSYAAHGYLFKDEMGGVEFLQAVIIPAILGAGLFAMWWLRRARRPSHILLSIWLHTAFLANAVFCLVVFKDNPNLGWWLTIISSAGMSTEMVLVFLGQIAQR